MVRVSTTEEQTRLFWTRYAPAETSDLHKYVQLRDALMRAIDDGFWAYGDKLPPEGELARLTPFSLGTAQKAYADMVREGMVERRAGAGSFVLRPSRILDTPWHFRFRSSADAPFLPVFPRIADVVRVEGEGPWSGFLKKGVDLVCIRRAVRIGTDFTLGADFYVDAALYDRAIRDGRKVEGVNLRRELGIQILRMTNDVRGEAFAPAQWPMIHAREGAPCLAVETRAYAQNPASNYFQRMLVPPTPDWLHISDFGAGAPTV